MSFTNSIYLAQAYRDCMEDYHRALRGSNPFHWDYILLTASNERQAKGYRAQLDERARAGMLPMHTHFAVIPDEGGQRVGSGGATLSVLRYIAEREGTKDFSGLCTLVIHSGGDSRRVPQYSALGKLFSPVPHALKDGRSSTLFDEFMISMASMPPRIREGMLLLSGDVLLLFNPLLVDYSGRGAAAISFKEPVGTGKDHGVYLSGPDGRVRRFLHKQSEERLREMGAVNDRGDVDIDTGAIIFSPEVQQALYGLIDTPEGYRRYVNTETRLSLYGDFQYPMAADSTQEQFYKEKPEGSFTQALHDARTRVWEVLRPFRMKLLRPAPSKFIHFGTTAEILGLMTGGVKVYEALGWSGCVNSSIPDGTAGYDSVSGDGARIGDGCYLEVSEVGAGATIGRGSVLSFAELEDETIPPDVVLHALKQKNGMIVARLFGVHDDIKGGAEATLLGGSLRALTERGVGEDELWEEGTPHDLWNARLYRPAGSMREAVAHALALYELLQGSGDIEAWRRADRLSLRRSFEEADPEAIIKWSDRRHDHVRMDALLRDIRAGVPVSEPAPMGELSGVQREWLRERLEGARFGEALRLRYYLGYLQNDEEQTKDAFRFVRDRLLAAGCGDIRVREDIAIAHERYHVELPLRVNWGGGWSDTPPYCVEHGGTVLNAAIRVSGRCPVQVTLERLEDRRIVMDSRDMDVHGEFTEITALQATGDPFDPFALQKAALVVCGVIPAEGSTLDEVLERLGGGFVLRSEVVGIPKGSGLGTSSILGAAVVKGILGFMGVETTPEELTRSVLLMEQIMSTGGGWQDQVGAIVGGIKYASSRPGEVQAVRVETLRVAPETQQALNDRFSIIYTGQRRLARNLLRSVMGRYIGNERDSLYALNEIQRIAALMRFELERGELDAFCELMDRHWELSRMIDAGSTNTLIDQIFDSIGDLIDARMICGAGGGGFLQVMRKRGVTEQAVHDRLKAVFADSEIDVWPCELI